MTSRGEPTLLGISFLIAVFPACGFGYNDHCYLQSCVQQLADSERHISGGLIVYTEPELEEVCRKFDDINVCVRRAKVTCLSSSFDSEVKQLWSGLQSSLTYLCKEAKHIYLKHASCFAQSALVKSIKFCNRTFHYDVAEKGQTNDILCSISNTFLHCLHKNTKDHCRDEAAEFEATIVRRLRQPKMDFHGCTLGSCRIRTSLLMMAVGVTLARLL